MLLCSDLHIASILEDGRVEDILLLWRVLINQLFVNAFTKINPFNSAARQMNASYATADVEKYILDKMLNKIT